MQIVEHIEQFAGMKGAGVAARALAEPALRRQRRAVEAEAENIGPPALLLRLDPGPGRMDDGQVAAERGGGSRLGLRRSVRIETQRGLRPPAEDRADKFCVGSLRVVALKQREVEAFVLVPSSHQRNVVLRVISEDFGRLAGQKRPVDDGAKAQSRRRGQDFVRWQGS